MKKVLFITNTFPNDENLSSGVFNFNAAIQLSDICNLTVIHARSWRPFRKIVQKKRIKGFDFICFSFPYYPFNNNFITGFQLFFYQLFIRIFLRDFIKRQDVIHSVGDSFSGVIGAYLSKKMNKPHIAQCIGTDVNVNLRDKKDSFFYSVLKKHVSIFTTNSFALESKIRSLYPKSQVKTIYRGVDLDFFNSDTNFHKNEKVVFAFIGGLSYRKEHHTGRDYKGGETLLRAWQLLGDYTRAELYFAGPDVSEELVNSILKKNSEELNIKVFSYLNREAIRKLLEIADVVVIPSWMEGLPNAGVEALASSCALLGSNVGGVPELINNNGYLFEPGDIFELHRLMRKIISSPSQLLTFKLNSKELALSKFCSSQFQEKYFRIYEEI